MGGANEAAASALSASTTSGRMSGGGIEVPWRRPFASVHMASKLSGSAGRNQANWKRRSLPALSLAMGRHSTISPPGKQNVMWW